MTAFVDASVLVAILGQEADGLDQAARIERTSDVITSAISVWEAAVALSRRFRFTLEDATQALEATLAAGAIRLVDIGSREASLALEAYARFGKGRHPAGLNMGDCFAYACAKAHDATLLYKGDDFARTDLA